MTLSPKWKYRFKKILPFGIIWCLLGGLFLTIEHIAIGDQSNASQTAVALDTQIVIFALSIIFVFGLVFGSMEVLWLDKIFKHRSFATKLSYKFLIYALFFQTILFWGFPMAASLELGVSFFNETVWERNFDFFLSSTHLSAFLQLSFSTLVSILYVEISNTVGQNVLSNFFTGKYHRPVEEDRIFMFIDMKNSTSIAEQLGHRKYFDFLQAYYDCFSDSIINHSGEVYQYVGDEIVISWSKKKGIEKNNSIRVFFSMKEAIARKSSEFKNDFGIIPDFRAGVHVGNITAGEIGALKKDIFFTGDVLNTTSRILSMSKKFKENLLISRELSELLLSDLPYEMKDLGAFELKGKGKLVEIIAVRSL